MGEKISLISAVQARNNARIIFAGSLELFEDQYVKSSETSNRLLIDEISKWNFGENGILKVSNIRHHRSDGGQPSKMLSDSNRPDQPIKK